MEHYCINCDGFFKPNKFDHKFGRCVRCGKHERKRERKRKAIFDAYADVQCGDLMEWFGLMCIVTSVLPDLGWVVHVPKLGTNQKVHVWADDTLETFERRLCRYRPNNETDKK